MGVSVCVFYFYFIFFIPRACGGAGDDAVVALLMYLVCRHHHRGLTLLGPQPRFGDNPLKLQVICSLNETAVLKGSI